MKNMTVVKNSDTAVEHEELQEKSPMCKKKINPCDPKNTMSRKCPKRNHAPAETSKLEVELTIPTTVRQTVSREWIKYVSTWALLRHVVYSRGIIPTPVDQIMNANKEELVDPEKKKKLSPTERKIVTASINIKTMLDDLKLLFDHQLGLSISTVLFVVGPSWSRPQEFYRISFPYIGEDRNAPGEENVNTTITNEHGLSRRLIRAFLEASQKPGNEKMSDFLLNPPPAGTTYQCHVMVQMSPDAANRLFHARHNSHLNQVDSKMTTENASKWCELSQKLVVRQNFSPESKTNRRQTIPIVEVSIKQQNAVDAQTTNLSESQSDASEPVWLSLKSFVKGFRP